MEQPEIILKHLSDYHRVTVKKIIPTHIMPMNRIIPMMEEYAGDALSILKELVDVHDDRYLRGMNVSSDRSAKAWEQAFKLIRNNK